MQIYLAKNAKNTYMYHSSIINENNFLKTKYTTLYNQYIQLHQMYVTLYQEKEAQLSKTDPIQSFVIPPEEVISALQFRIAELSKITTVVVQEHKNNYIFYNCKCSKMEINP